MTDNVIPIDKDTRALTLEAASSAASLQRQLDRVHLEGAVVHTDMGPAVLWSDVLRVMPLEHEAGARQHRLET